MENQQTTIDVIICENMMKYRADKCELNIFTFNRIHFTKGRLQRVDTTREEGMVLL
jgi:hypothetical protein